MKMNHRLTLVVGLLCAVAVEVLAKGSWSHAVWAPTLIMLITSLEKVISGEKAPIVSSPSSPPPPPPPTVDSSTPAAKP